MADFEFEITAGAYVGRYELEMSDFSAADANAFRQAVGVSLVSVVVDGGADIDAIAGLVWLVLRRRSKSLPYAAVADQINYGNVAELTPGGEAGGGLDPTSPSPNASG